MLADGSFVSDTLRMVGRDMKSKQVGEGDVEEHVSDVEEHENDVARRADI
jgi:hypothetical protein